MKAILSSVLTLFIGYKIYCKVVEKKLDYLPNEIKDINIAHLF